MHLAGRCLGNRIGRAVLSTALVLGAGTAVALAATPAAGAAAPAIGSVLSWGSNADGYLGDGSATPSQLPVQVSLPTGTRISQIASSHFATYAITTSGSVLAWGDGSDGELGTGSSAGSDVPVPVDLPAGTVATSVAAGHDFGLVATSTGAVYAWGDGYDGELGNGQYEESDTPVQVELPEGELATAVAAGHDTGYALTSDGEVYAWGYGEDGELGDENDDDTSTPVTVQFQFGGSIVAIAAGAEDALALTGGGAVYAWGYGGDGELGTGSSEETDAPVEVDLPADVDVTAIASGHYFSLALSSTGAVYSWGEGGYGQLGDGADDDSYSPVQVELPGGVTATAVAGGSEHALALTSSGAVYAWGDDDYGQLGDDSTTSTDIPVAVQLPPGATATGVAAGNYFSLAVLGAPQVAGISPGAGPAAGATPVTISGLDFSAVHSVLFGSEPATSVQVVTDTRLVAVAPAGIVGSVPVTVVTANGTVTAPATSRFGYTPIEPVEAPLPAGAPSGASTELQAISCTSATTCVAVGQIGSSKAMRIGIYGDNPPANKPPRTAPAGRHPSQQAAGCFCSYALIETLADGHWTPLQAPEPGNAGTNDEDDQYADLDAVSCSSASSCTAVGVYEDDDGYDYGLVDTLSGGSWTSLMAPLPENAGDDDDGDGYAELDAVTCPTAATCLAVGDYQDTEGYQYGLVDSLSAAGWAASEAPEPANAGDDDNRGYGELDAVACGSATSCAAVGYYQDSDGYAYGLLEALAGGTWSATEAPQPANAGGDGGGQYAELDAVACPSAGRCTAVGEYEDSERYSFGLVETLAGGSWSGAEAPQPANAGSEAQGDQGTILWAVSCPSTTSCTAAGAYDDANGDSDDLFESYAGGRWTPSEGPQAADAASGATSAGSKDVIDKIGRHSGGALQIDCVSATACEYVSSYEDAEQYAYGLADTLAAGRWSALEAPEPADAGTDADSYADAGLVATSCAGAGVCYSVGSYTDDDGDGQGLIEEPAIAPVRDVTASPECEQVDLSWADPPTPGYAGAYVERSTAGPPATDSTADRIATVGAAATSYTDRGLTPGRTYYYAVFARGAGGFVEAGADAAVTESCPALPGYRLEGGDGGVFAFHQTYRGSVPPPSPPGLGLHIDDAVAMAITGTGGYWVVLSDGGTFDFDATDYGTLPSRGIHVDDIVGAASTPYGLGYWMVGADGTVYAFGDAPYLGSLSGLGTTRVVAIASAGLGGYWVVTSTGNVVAFGDAHYFGSCQDGGSACAGATDIVGIDPSGAGGYWLVGRDGGVFTFGDARFRGSCPETGSSCRSVDDVVGIASPDPGGYWLAEADGGVITFGDAHYFGNELGAKLTRPIVGISS